MTENPAEPAATDLPANNYMNAEGVVREHPLLNSVVMTKVFTFLEPSATVTEVKTYRSVCRLWSILGLKMWRDKATLRVGLPESCPLDTLPSGPYLPINYYLDNLANPQSNLQLSQYPFKRLLLCNIDFTSSEALPAPLQMDNGAFWPLLNPDNLQLNGFVGCTFSGSDLIYFEQLLTSTLVQNTNLILSGNQLRPSKSSDALRNQMQRFTSPDYQPRNGVLKNLTIVGEFPMRAVVLFFHCFKLQSLVLRGNYQTEQECHANMLFAGIEHRRGLFPELGGVSISKMDVMFSRFFSDIQYPVHIHLNRGLFPLEHLTLTLDCIKPNNYSREQPSHRGDIHFVWMPLLQHHGSFLKSLQVFRSPLHTPPGKPALYNLTEKMPALEQFRVWGNLLVSFQFLQKMPNLKRLFINTYCFDMAEHMKALYYSDGSIDKIEQFRQAYKPYCQDFVEKTPRGLGRRIKCLEMKELRLECVLSAEMVRVLSGWMPNLKKFEGILGPEEFKAVCKWMPDLEELGILRGSQVGDRVLTGWTFKERHAGSRNPANITVFKKLKHFRFFTYCGIPGLGDWAVRDGLLEMQSLESVYICVRENYVTGDLEEQLRQRVGKVTIVRNNDLEQCGKWDWCEQEKFIREVVQMHEFVGLPEKKQT